MNDIYRVNSFATAAQTPVNVEYLDITNFTEESDEIFERIAYVTSASPGRTRTESGFVRFQLKDCKGRPVTARMFDVKDFIFSGIKASKLRNRMVKIKFKPQSFNGRLSLVLTGVDGLEFYDEAVDISCFVGTVPVDTTGLKYLSKVFLGDNWEQIISEYEMVGVESVGFGRVGAFAAVLNSAVVSISSMSWLSEDEIRELISCLLVSVDVFFRCKPGDDKLVYYVREMNKWEMKLDKKELMPVIMEITSALLEISSPTKLYSHIALTAYKNALTSMQFALTAETMPVGAETWINNTKLIS